MGVDIYCTLQQRRRNESVESSFEIVNNECCSRLKHNSSSSLTSVIPSSFSSNCTTLSDGIWWVIGRIGIKMSPPALLSTRNGILQEGVEPNDANGHWDAPAYIQWIMIEAAVVPPSPLSSDKNRPQVPFDEYLLSFETDSSPQTFQMGPSSASPPLLFAHRYQPQFHSCDWTGLVLAH